MNMKDKQQLAQSTEEGQIREALNSHWHASAVGDKPESPSAFCTATARHPLSGGAPA
jgi:hypothetical protein